MANDITTKGSTSPSNLSYSQGIYSELASQLEQSSFTYSSYEYLGNGGWNAPNTGNMYTFLQDNNAGLVMNQQTFIYKTVNLMDWLYNRSERPLIPTGCKLFTLVQQDRLGIMEARVS